MKATKRNAMAAMADDVFSAAPTASAASHDALETHHTQGRGRRSSAYDDAVLLRLVAEKDPFGAPHGTKGAVWDDVAHALRQQQQPDDKRKWNGLACRTRVYGLLEGYDIHRAGKRTPSVIKRMSPQELSVLEHALLQVAKTRTEKQLMLLNAKEKGNPATAGGEDAAPAPLASVATSAASVAARAPKAAKAAAVAEPVAAKAHVVASTMAVASANAGAGSAGGSGSGTSAGTFDVALPVKATVVAKRRKRKGVKTKEQKRATAAMMEAMRHSREEYMNQLRVETAVQAAANETSSSSTKSSTTKPKHKSVVDSDLIMLRAVVKHAPFDVPTTMTTEAGTSGEGESEWQAVAEQVLRKSSLKFPPRAIRDRCDALLADFEANDGKRSSFTSGVEVADEERLKLLRMIFKAQKKQQRKMSMDKPHEKTRSGEKATVATTTAVMATMAIEIEDEQDTGEERDQSPLDEEDEEETEEQQMEENDDDREEVEAEQQAEEEEEEEEPEQTPLPPRKRRRPENNGGASPDADPAVAMEMEMEIDTFNEEEDEEGNENDDDNDDEIQGDSQDSQASHDYTPRKYKQRRLEPTEELVEQNQQQIRQAQEEEGQEEKEEENTEEELPIRDGAHDAPASHLDAVLQVMAAERQERRVEFHALLDLMQSQLRDHSSKWDRESTRRAHEQDHRERETRALLELLRGERADRRSEVAAFMATIAKEREDRRHEFTVMMNLVTKMVDKATPSPSPSPSSSSS